MEENLELKFAQIDKSGLVQFTNNWTLTEYNNGAFFLTNNDEELKGKRIVMVDSNEHEVWSSKVMYMSNVFFDEDKQKYEYISTNALNIKNIPNVNDKYYVYIEGTDLSCHLDINIKLDDKEEETNLKENTICDYLKKTVAKLENERKYTFFHNKASVNFVRFAQNKFQFSAVDKDNGHIWFEVDYKSPAEEEKLREMVANINEEFEYLNLKEVSNDEENFASIAEVIVKN